jgi:hypothetical protein
VSPVSVVQAGAGHPLAQPTLFDKVLFEAAKLLIYQKIGLVDETNCDVGNHVGWAGLKNPR